jgi:hypothetical protein
MPGEDGDSDNYVVCFKALKMLNSDKYVSYECGCLGDWNVVLSESIKILQEQWGKA